LSGRNFQQRCDQQKKHYQQGDDETSEVQIG
jgi:hypothetical protein